MRQKVATTDDQRTRIVLGSERKHLTDRGAYAHADTPQIRFRDTVNQTRAELEALKTERPTLKGVDRLIARLSQEEGILSRMESDEVPADMDAKGRPNVGGLKNNVDSIRAELRGVQNDPNATEVVRSSISMVRRSRSIA